MRYKRKKKGKENYYIYKETLLKEVMHIWYDITIIAGCL